jgi:hypothetical protein
MNGESDATFEDEKSFIACNACLERSTDVAPRARLIQVRAGTTEPNGDQLHLLARQNSAGPRTCPHSQQQFSPFGIPLLEFVQR